MTSAKGRLFKQASGSVFAALDELVEPEEERYVIHPTARELWGRNLDGVDPAATEAAMDPTVVASKDEAESMLDKGTRAPKSMEEIKELRRRLALDIKRRHPKQSAPDQRLRLPATKMPPSDFTTTAAAKKLATTNPFGSASKSLDAFLKPLAEAYAIRREIIEVLSSEAHYQMDELKSAIAAGATAAQLVEIVDRIQRDATMAEVVSQELLLLPTFIVANRFIDLQKKEKDVNQGNAMSNATIAAASAAGIKVMVSPGSQKYFGSESNITKPIGAAAAKAKPPAKLGATPTKRLSQKEFKKRKLEREKVDRAKSADNQPVPKGGGQTPGKATGAVPGTSAGSPNHNPGSTPRSGTKHEHSHKKLKKDKTKGSKGGR